VKQAEADVTKARAELRPLERSETIATNEQAEAVRARDHIAKLEGEIADLDARITQELNPPGGFTREEIFEGRRPGRIPALSPATTPSGVRYYRLVDARTAALRELESETSGLTRALQDQVTAATPGPAAKAAALQNAASLPAALQPVGGVPIDVTTGMPMQSSNWATDHIVARAEIARDPRFLRLTPLQRDAMLLDIPKNYLPMTIEANSSKSDWTVDEWIALRAARGEPVPADVAAALRIADREARAAIEAQFSRFLSQ